MIINQNTKFGKYLQTLQRVCCIGTLAIIPTLTAAKDLKPQSTPVEFELPGSSDSTPAQREKARELLEFVKENVSFVLSASASSRCEILKQRFVVDRLSERCSASETKGRLTLKKVWITIGSRVEAASPADYTFVMGFESKSNRKRYNTTVYIQLPDSRLRIDSPANMASIINSTKGEK
jgi:hypothetical protein